MSLGRLCLPVTILCSGNSVCGHQEVPEATWSDQLGDRQVVDLQQRLKGTSTHSLQNRVIN